MAAARLDPGQPHQAHEQPGQQQRPLMTVAEMSSLTAASSTVPSA